MLFTRKEVSRISTLSWYQLDALRQHGIDIPYESSVRDRFYDPNAFFQILLIRELRVRNFEYPTIRRILNQIKWRGPINRLPWESGLKWLLTDGQTVHFIAHPDVVLAFLEQRRNPAFRLISLQHMEQRMKLARPYTPPRKPLRAVFAMTSNHETLDNRVQGLA